MKVADMLGFPSGPDGNPSISATFIDTVWAKWMGYYVADQLGQNWHSPIEDEVVLAQVKVLHGHHLSTEKPEKGNHDNLHFFLN